MKSPLLLGTLSRRERWGLTARGWLMVLLASIGGFVAAVWTIHPFLALTAPADSEIMVVEGWMPPPALEKVVARYGPVATTRIITTGGPVDEALGSTRVEDTSAAEAAQHLESLGFSPERLTIVPSFVSERDRTYASAVALRSWWAEQGMTISALNVITEGAHARRSRYLFQQAFGPGVQIGVISIPNHEYDAGRWWRYSEGVKSVISESAAYLYARILFQPNKPHT